MLALAIKACTVYGGTPSVVSAQTHLQTEEAAPLQKGKGSAWGGLVA